jgi:hypothetical protein
MSLIQKGWAADNQLMAGAVEGALPPLSFIVSVQARSATPLNSG